MSIPNFSSLGLPNLRPTRGVEIKLSKLFTSLQPGMHLAINRSMAPHWHHGIYVGEEGEEHVIVDMWGQDKASARVQKRFLDEFLEGAVRICIIQYDSEDLIELRAAAVVRALTAIRPGVAQPLYDIFANNCECFAFWCCTGWCELVPDTDLFNGISPYVPGFKD